MVTYGRGSRRNQERLSTSKGTVLHTWVRGYEDAQKEVRLNVAVHHHHLTCSSQVIKLKNTYLTKTRKADEAEDEFVTIFIYTILAFTNALQSTVRTKQRPKRPLHDISPSRTSRRTHTTPVWNRLRAHLAET